MQFDDVHLLQADASGCAVEGVCLPALTFWDCGFESHRGAWMFVVSVVCCQVEVSATGRSLAQGAIAGGHV